MKKNMSSIIFEQVSSINKNNYKARKQVIEEDSYHLSPRFDRAQSFYGKAKIDDNDGEIILTSYQTPILKIKDGVITWLCKKEHLTQTTMRHIRDFLKQMDYENKIELSGKDYPITRKWVMDKLPKEDLEEEVTIDNPSAENKTTEEISRESQNIDLNKKQEVEQRINELRKSLEDGNIPAEEKEAVEKEITELSSMLESVVLTEAPEDEEFEVIDEPIEEPMMDEPMEEPLPDEEMSDEEVQDEVVEDEEETIKDDIEQPFYATTPEYDELRDLLIDLDYRLFLINDNMVCIGRLNGPDIEFLTSNRPDDVEIEKSEQNEKSDEVQDRAEEDGEQSFEYLWIKAPDTLDKFVNQVNVVYLSPEMTEEDKEQYAGIEASHDSVMSYLMNELPEDKRKEHEENEEPVDEIPMDIPVEEPTMEEPVEDEFADEEPIEEPMEDEEEEEI
jgi:hypothetical protein